MSDRIGKYTVVAELGGGGMGTLLLVRDDAGNERVLKTVRPDIRAKFPKADARFRREARIHSGLRHPNIVKVFETFEHEGATYMVMEYVERGSLRGALHRLDRAQAVEVILDVLDGLIYAHDKGVAHGDIKPENLVVTDRREVKLTDFGIAQAFETVTKPPGAAATTRFVSDYYGSPEQKRGHSITTSSDLYSLGVVAHELLFGTRPPQSGPLTGDRLTPWLQKLLAEDPDQRPDARQAAAELRAIEQEPEGTDRWKLAALAAVLIVLAGFVWGVGLDGDDTTGELPGPTPIGTALTESREVPIGVALTTSDTDGANAEVYDGIKLAVAYLNERGHVPNSAFQLKSGLGLPALGGAKIKLIVSTNTAPERCEMDDVVRELIAKGAVAIVGAYESTYTLRALSAADGHVVLINAGSTVTALAQRADGGPDSKPELCKDETLEDKRPSPWFFRVGPDDQQAAEVFFNYLRTNHPRLHKVVLVGEREDFWGSRVMSDVRRAAQANDVEFEWLNYKTIVDDPDALAGRCTRVHEIRQVARDLAAADADVVFVASYRADAVAVAKAMDEVPGYRIPTLYSFGSAYTEKGFFTDIRKPETACGMAPVTQDVTAIGRVAWAANAAHPSTTTREIAALYGERTGGEKAMTPTVALGFTATMALAQAIDNADSLRPEAIRDAMSALDVGRDQTITAWEGIRFNAGGHNDASRVFLQRVFNGTADERLLFPPGS